MMRISNVNQCLFNIILLKRMKICNFLIRIYEAYTFLELLLLSLDFVVIGVGSQMVFS